MTYMLNMLNFLHHPYVIHIAVRIFEVVPALMCICVYVWRPELNVELIVSSVGPSMRTSAF